MGSYIFDLPFHSDCLEVVFDADKLVCLQCECSFESRNALLIAVSEKSCDSEKDQCLDSSLKLSSSCFQCIVYSTLVIAFCCMPPCAFVVCIQPWIKVKALRTYAGPSLHSPVQLLYNVHLSAR